MSPHLRAVDPLPYAGKERRGKPRIHEHFRVRVWSTDADGTRFETDTHLENLSSSGLFVRLPREVEPGESVLVLVHFTGSNAEEARPRVAAHGTVVRSRRTTHSMWETGIRFRAHIVL